MPRWEVQPPHPSLPTLHHSLVLTPRPLPQKVERMSAALHLIGAPAANKHTVFVDGEEEVRDCLPAC